MGQELIALNGNEQFPYQLQPNDIANAMGLPNGIAPGGYNGAGAISTSSGAVSLSDNAWNNVIEVSGTTTSITIPSSSPTNAIITFYPNTQPTNDPNATWTLEVNTGQYIYSPTTGITNNTTTAINVPYTNSLTILSRGNGEIDIIGGTYLFTNNTGNNTINGIISISPSNFIRNNYSSKNLLVNPGWFYGLSSGWTYSSSISGLVSIGYNANNYYISINANNESFTITSNKINMTYGNGTILILSGDVFNNVGNSAVTSTSNPVTFSINYYDSSDTLLESAELFSVPSATPWTFYVGTNLVNSTTAAASYYTITISGTTASTNNNIAISQLKLELSTNTLALPTLYSDESSILQYSYNSFSANGYQQLPSGLIMQWGQATNTGQSGSTPGTATFPIAFPNACFQVLMTDTGVEGFRYSVDSVTASSFLFTAVITETGGTPTYAGSNIATGRFIAYGW